MTSQTISIRECVISDAEAVIDLLPQLWPDQTLDRRMLAETFQAAMNSPRQKYLCATLESKIVGFCSVSIKYSLWRQRPLAHVDELVVDSCFRSHGIGTELLERASELAVSMECDRIELDSALHRRDAHRFYEQMGFEREPICFRRDFSE